MHRFNGNDTSDPKLYHQLIKVGQLLHFSWKFVFSFLFVCLFFVIFVCLFILIFFFSRFCMKLYKENILFML